MTELKCVRCGAPNVSVEQLCNLCTIELYPATQPFSRSILFPEPVVHWENRNRSITPSFYGTSNVIGPTLGMFTRNFWLITKLVVVIVTPFEIFKALSLRDIPNDWQLAMGIYVLDLVCKVLIAPALIYGLMRVMQTGKSPGINESFRWGFGKVVKLSVAAAVAWLLQTLGFALCIVPGIIVALSMQIVYPIAVLEKGSAMQALKSSRDLTEGHRWNILGANIVIWIVIGVICLPLEAMVTSYVTEDFSLWPLQVTAAVFADILRQLTTVLSLVVYLGIRGLSESRHSVIE